jgi:hypothetical protein
LIKFKFGFENLLKICFEKLEKEKGKEFLFFSGRFLLPQPTPRPASPRAARSLQRPPSPAWAEPSRGQPAQLARGRVPHPAAAPFFL